MRMKIASLADAGQLFSAQLKYFARKRVAGEFVEIGLNEQVVHSIGRRRSGRHHSTRQSTMGHMCPVVEQRDSFTYEIQLWVSHAKRLPAGIEFFLKWFIFK